jgi:hypothetical protein
MTTEEQIEEILMEANSMGFRTELIELAKNIMEINPTIRRVDAYESAYNQILFESEIE